MLLVFGLGYCGLAVAEAARAARWPVTATMRSAPHEIPGIAVIPFEAAAPAIAEATHLLVTAPPGDAGDPVLARYADALAAAPSPRWIGYLSSTGVYGDRGGAWVDETTEPAPTGPRGARRLAAENAWREAAGGRALDLFRLAGIYGPARSPFEALRNGTARRVASPGHEFGRIHRDDIAAAVLAAMVQDPPAGTRVLNLADDTPAETADVIAEAARLLGVAVPEAVPFEVAQATMSPMARSFWADNRKVASRRTQAALGLAWRYPSYREGLRAILATEGGAGEAGAGEAGVEERRERPAQ